MSPSFGILLFTVCLLAVSLTSLPAVLGCSGLTQVSTAAYSPSGTGSGGPLQPVGGNLLTFFPVTYSSSLYGKRIYSLSAELQGASGLVALAAYTFSSPKTPSLIVSTGAQTVSSSNYRDGLLSLDISPHIPLKNASLPHFAGIYIAIASASPYNISASNSARAAQMNFNLTASSPLPHFTQPPVDLPWIGAVAANICA
jgi:hypothetical protein